MIAPLVVLTPPTAATSNRNRRAELGGLGGLAIGCLFGCSVAIWLAARLRRRVMRGAGVAPGVVA